MKKALITGITGQDGSYLTEFLLNKKYEVHGIRRKTSQENLNNLIYLEPFEKKNLFLHYGDLTDGSSLSKIINNIQPDEIYNLAAQSHVHTSFIIPEQTLEINANGTLKILEIIKNLKKPPKFYQASTSELYGNSNKKKQNELTKFSPTSPYAISKLYAHYLVQNYRNSFDLFLCNGILFNHESPRRGKTFVTSKIVNSIARIKMNKLDKFYLGNVNAKRDWGYAKDYVKAMWKMLQQKNPDDYVIATGKNISVKKFVEKCFKFVDINVYWKGSGLNEKCLDTKTNKVLIEIDPYYYRPTDVEELLGDYTKAKNKLNWRPSVQIDELISIMMTNELKKIKS